MRDFVINRFGLEIEVEKTFVEKDDFGNVINDYFLDEYNAAKLLAYENATSLLPLAEEQAKIAHILTIGIANYTEGGAQ